MYMRIVYGFYEPGSYCGWSKSCTTLFDLCPQELHCFEGLGFKGKCCKTSSIHSVSNELNTLGPKQGQWLEFAG